jgi:hypothetical protein
MGRFRKEVADVVVVLVVSPLTFEAVSLFMLLFRFCTHVLPHNAKEYSEVGEVNVVCDERNGSNSVGS